MPRRKKGGRTAGVNKSAAVREYLKSHPTASPNEVKEALGEKGIAISTSLASNIKYTKKGKAAGRKRGPRRMGRRPGRPPGTKSGVRIDDLLEVKRLASRMGGIAATRKALDLLEQLA